jgi:hypothetical protein
MEQVYGRLVKWSQCASISKYTSHSDFAPTTSLM